jgi:hypothetical protein
MALDSRPYWKRSEDGLKYVLRGCEMAFTLSRGGYGVCSADHPGSHFAYLVCNGVKVKNVELSPAFCIIFWWMKILFYLNRSEIVTVRNSPTLII